jgi:hypothetical protein
MKDPVLVLGWIWAVYLAVRLGAEAVSWIVPRRSPDASPIAKTKWDPTPALVWLAREALLVVLVVGGLWLVLRDVTLDLVPSAVSAGPIFVRQMALAGILGWSLVVINWPAAMQLLRILLPAPASKNPEKERESERMGATIGVLERLLTIALMSGGPTAIGLVIAAKTLARHKELDDKPFAERYLIGTMSSVAIAVLSAMAAQWVWSAAQ